jgi:hypothetical protein
MTARETDKRNHSLRERIANICSGLTFVSETDAPVELFDPGVGNEISVADLIRAAEKKPNTFAEVQDAAAFLDRLSEIKSWYTEEEKRNAKRFARLRKVLTSELADLKMFRIGAIQIDIFVVGRDRAGNSVGIRTRAVET